MKTLLTAKRLVLAGMAALIMGASTAHAYDDYCGPSYVYKTVVCYRTVICYHTHSEAYQVCLTQYDECGHPYQVYKTCYRDVRVPFEKQVPFTKVVRVPVY